MVVNKGFPSHAFSAKDVAFVVKTCERVIVSRFSNGPLGFVNRPGRKHYRGSKDYKG